LYMLICTFSFLFSIQGNCVGDQNVCRAPHRSSLRRGRGVKRLKREALVAGSDNPDSATKVVSIFGTLPNWRSSQMPTTKKWPAISMARWSSAERDR
jgi:hypothetical protein